MIPLAGWTHSEGIEAADPSTPAAVLRFESATARYAGASAEPLPWRLLFDGRPPQTSEDNGAPEAGTSEHSGHAGAAPAIPATMQRQ